MSSVMVVAPHPDDETLGCGGTLLKHKAAGDSIHWLIMTGMSDSSGYTSTQKSQRAQEIKTVSQHYQFDSVHELAFPTAQLDNCHLKDVIDSVAKALNTVKPAEIYLPYENDIHTDHYVTHRALMACSKWFRFNFIKRMLVYEVVSETNFVLSSSSHRFKPNIYVDISQHLDNKIEILKVYKDEILDFPFPRSIQAVKSLAMLRGSEAGFEAAESFMLIKEVIS